MEKRTIVVLEVQLQLAHFHDTLNHLHKWGDTEKVRLIKSLGKELIDLGKALAQVDSVDQLKL